MPRGVYDRKAVTAAPVVKSTARAAQTTTALAKSDVTSSLVELAWWAKLGQEEQRAVMEEGQKLSIALVQFGTSRLKIGEHLTRLQAILEPHNLFGKFLRNFHFSKRTAYRYIAGFNNAKARLPETVLNAAMARGMNLIGESEIKPLGIYTKAVEKLPPPVRATPVQAETWLNQVEQVRKDARGENGTDFTISVNSDPALLLKESYRFVSLRYKRLPNNTRTKQAWVKNLVGMLLTDTGAATPQTFAPHAVPEDFKALRGRPVTPATTATAAVA